MISHAIAGAQQITLRAVVTRADGTVEDLGEIAFWHKNPIIRAWARVKNFFRR
jgi:hypothetical protein